jgi:hypothetical protein
MSRARREAAARAIAAMLGGLAGLAAGCQREAPPAPDVAARIGGMEVHYAEFEDYVARVAGDAESGLAGGVLSQLFDQFLDEKLLERLAADRGVTQGQGGRRAVDGLLADSLTAAPDEEEVARYYREHRGEFARPERVRLRQILTEDRATAERAVAELAAGGDFAGLARRVSRDPSARAGGAQGELARQDLPPAFAEVIFALRPGEMSRIVPADYGFHIFQVTARMPAEVVPLDQARGEIRRRLRRERADRELARLVRESRRQYTVTVYERNLPFEYEGIYRDEHAEKSR